MGDSWRGRREWRRLWGSTLWFRGREEARLDFRKGINAVVVISERGRFLERDFLGEGGFGDEGIGEAGFQKRN
jgi:hypothetical protein